MAFRSLAALTFAMMAAVPAQADGVTNTCVVNLADLRAATNPVTFTLDEATTAINSYCIDQGMRDPTITSPSFYNFPSHGKEWRMKVSYNTDAALGCTAAVPAGSAPTPSATSSTALSEADCITGFLSAVNNCDTTTTTEKLGQYPMVVNSGGSCLQYEIIAYDSDTYMAVETLIPDPSA